MFIFAAPLLFPQLLVRALANENLLSSTTRKRIFDQVVDVVEGDFVDGLLDFVEAGRLAFEEGENGSFNGWTARLDAWNVLDDNRRTPDNLNVS